MNAKDIAKALKCCYAPEGNGSCEGCPYDGAEGLCYRLNIEYHAGETIESLLALLDAAIAGQETLQKALVESQRRERAAVSDLEELALMAGECYGCIRYDHDEDRCTHGIYAVTCDMGNENRWQWRGPQEGEPHETL